MKIGSLFAGIGGFDLAARWMGWETEWFSEIDPYASAVLKKHWPHVPNLGDITTITNPPPVDMLVGGFPCQDISLAGKGEGIGGSRSGLWKHYARLIEEVRPAWIVAENVSALRSRGLDVVLKDLDALGYDAEWHCIPASYVGAPHRRDRIWIVAYAQILGIRPGLREDQSPEIRGRRLSDCCSADDVAHTDDYARKGRARTGPVLEGRKCAPLERTDVRREGTPCAADVGPSGEVVADTEGEGLEGRLFGRNDGAAVPGLGQGGGTVESHWLVEPDVGRVAHGVPSRVDRLKCLGNAIVPQVAYEIFQAINDTLND